jgi:hypothetical protein
VIKTRPAAYKGLMKARGTTLWLAGAAALLAGCGSGAKPTAHHPTSPPTTIAGVGLMMSDSPPKPSTPAACLRRWNGTANANGRAGAAHHVPQADGALVRKAGGSGYFASYAGRCLIYLVARQRAAVFVETSPGRFRFIAGASGHFSPNAGLGQDTRLRLR